jgi:hypothetical protein
MGLLTIATIRTSHQSEDADSFLTLRDSGIAR